MVFEFCKFNLQNQNRFARASVGCGRALAVLWVCDLLTVGCVRLVLGLLRVWKPLAKMTEIRNSF